MKKILIHSNYSPVDSFGGIELVVSQLIKALSMENFFIQCFCGSHENKKFNKSKIEYLYRKILFKFNGAPMLHMGNINFIYHGIKSDLIIFQEPFPFLWPAVLILRMIFFKKIIVLVHADPVAPNTIKKIYKILRTVVFKGCVCVTTSPNLFEKIFSTKFSSCHIIPLCIEMDSLVQVRTEVDYDVPKRFALYIGRLASYKGIEILLQAAEKIPDVEIVIAGQGPLANFISKKLLEKGLVNVHFYNEFISESNKLALISMSEFVIFPSTNQNEAFGLVQLEVMRAGKPLINTELDTGVNFVAPHMVTALTVPPKNAGALADSIHKLWNDEVLSCQLGNNSRQRYLENFTEKNFFESWTKLINEELC